MNKTLQPQAQALLDAHVEFLLGTLDADALQPRFVAAIDQFLVFADGIALEDAVNAGQIKQTAHRYAIEMQFGAAIPELVGDIARKQYGHKTLDKTRLEDLVPDAAFAEFLDKTLELKAVYRALVRESVSNPIYASAISDQLYAGIRDFVSSLNFPGSKSAARVGRAIKRRARPELGDEIEESLLRFIQKGTTSRLRASEKHFLEAIEGERLRELLLDLWDDNKQRKVADVRDYASSRDIEEFFVIGYEYFQHLRETRLFRELVDAGIDTFFAKYGRASLLEIIDEIGVTREMMLAEAMQFAPPILEMLREKNLLDSLVRAKLTEFYASDAVRTILDEPHAGNLTSKE